MQALLRAFSFLMILMVLTGLSMAAQKIERLAYIVGPAGDQAERVMEILQARMSRLDLNPTVTREGDNIRVEVDAGYAAGYEIDVLTFRALPRIYDNIEIVSQCPKNATRECIGTPNHPEIGGLISVFKVAPMGGDIIEEVELQRDGAIARVIVRFTDRAAGQFADLTKQNIGKRLALVADRILLAAPVVREPILGGTAMISGDVDYMEAWAIMLSEPPLPYKLEFLRDEAAEPIIRGRRKRR